jgi:hypothetical protein
VNPRKGRSQFLVRPFREQIADSLDGVQPHPSRAASRKKTEDHLFPYPGVVFFLPNSFKFRQSRAYLAEPRSVCRLHGRKF